MNTEQTKSLQSLATQFLERASGYLDQADVCYDQLEASTNQLADYLERAREADGDRYHELAQKLFAQVNSILEILETAGHKDEKLAGLCAAARNSSALIGAVQSSRKTGSFSAIER